MDDTATYFDQRAARYVGDDWHDVYARRLVELAHLVPGQRVLDAATGTGFAALAAARAVGPTGHVVGVDVSDGMLTQAERLRHAAGLANVSYVRADAATLAEFSDASFDVVLCSAGMLYLPVHAALTTWHRVLKPGGLVGFSAMCAGYPLIADLFRRCAAEFDVEVTDPHAELGDVDRCRQALRDAGFAPERVEHGDVSLPDTDGEQAWRLHATSPHYAEVAALPTSRQDALRERFTAALAQARRADADLARAPVLYAFGRKPQDPR